MFKNFLKLLFILFFILCIQGCATANNKGDQWLGRDKLHHLLTASVIGAAATKTSANNGISPCDSVFIGITAAITLGTGKEFYDKYVKKTYFSWKDMFWNVAGGTLGGLATREC